MVKPLMIAAIQFRWLGQVVLWLWLSGSSIFCPSTFAYDGPSRLQIEHKIGYDVSRLTATGYDGIAVLATNEYGSDFPVMVTLVVVFSEFLAEEGEASATTEETAASPYCFAAGTTVSTPSGDVNIADPGKCCRVPPGTWRYVWNYCYWPNDA